MTEQDDATRLVRIFDLLAPVQRQTLLAFAEFLLNRHRKPGEARLSAANSNTTPGVLAQPVFEERPDTETVAAALSRLSRVYHMLDADTLVERASDELLNREAIASLSPRALVDELERFFAEQYQRAKLLS